MNTQEKVLLETMLHRGVFGGTALVSRLAGKVWKIRAAYGIAADDLAVWHAPRECYGVVAREEKKALAALFQGAGIHPANYNRILLDRVSGKAAFTLGLEVCPEDFPPGAFDPDRWEKDPTENLYWNWIWDIISPDPEGG